MQVGNTVARKAVACLLSASMLCSAAAHAQALRSAVGVPPRQTAAATPQPYNSMAKSTTPFNCLQYRDHPYPGMVAYCQSIENMSLRNEARRQGRPAPSDSIIRLPGLGTAQAKALGHACVRSKRRRCRHIPFAGFRPAIERIVGFFLLGITPHRARAPWLPVSDGIAVRSGSRLSRA